MTNIADRRYFSWGTVGGLADSSRIELCSASGRAARVGLRATY